MSTLKQDVTGITQSFIRYDINNGAQTTSNYKTDTFTVQVFSSQTYQDNINYSKENKLSIVDITPCLNKIKEYLNITNDSVNIPIEKIDFDPSLTSTTGKGLGDVTYNYYNPYTGEKLNSTEICSNTKTSIKLPLNTSDINITLYDKYRVKNINIYDKESDFFNTRCYSYQDDNGMDVPLTERASTLFPGAYLSCSTGCTFSHIDSDNYTVCECNETNSTRADIGNDNPFIEGITNSNLDIFLCASRAFNSVKLFNLEYALWEPWILL
jgi:hypothetical protein